VKFLMEMDDPHAMKSTTDVADPNLANERRLIEDPTCK
jgi:hypothetical protein